MLFERDPPKDDAVFVGPDLQDLVPKGLLSALRPDGTRLLATEMMPATFNEQQKMRPVPERFVSFATLIYVGFTPQKANEIWTAWNTHWPSTPSNAPRTFRSFISSRYVPMFSNNDARPDHGEAEWLACLEWLGMAADVKEAIMDPDYRLDGIRRGKSCLSMVMDGFDLLWNNLRSIHWDSKYRAKTYHSGPSPFDFFGIRNYPGAPSDRGLSGPSTRKLITFRDEDSFSIENNPGSPSGQSQSGSSTWNLITFRGEAESWVDDL